MKKSGRIRKFDVIVCGGGVAGIAAAVEASRSGMNTALVEKTIIPGGLATNGLILIYESLCDGNGRQCNRGLAEEFFRLSIKYGPGSENPGWKSARNAGMSRRYRTFFSPASFVLALDELILESDITVFLDTLVCLPVMDNGRIVGVEMENADGRSCLKASCVIDATGDATVASRAGAPCVNGTNFLSFWGLQASLENAAAAVKARNGRMLLQMFVPGADASGKGQPRGEGLFKGVNAALITDYVLKSRGLLRGRYLTIYREKGAEAREKCFPIALPGMPQLRTVRRIAGRITLTSGQHAKHFEDSIGLVADWRKPGYVWEIPYGAMVPKKIKGLLAAGRCISSAKDAWEITRVIPPCVHTGQIAGLAAALSLRLGVAPDQLAPKAIQRVLTERSIPFHLHHLEAI